MYYFEDLESTLFLLDITLRYSFRLIRTIKASCPPELSGVCGLMAADGFKRD